MVAKIETEDISNIYFRHTLSSQGPWVIVEEEQKDCKSYKQKKMFLYTARQLHRFIHRNWDGMYTTCASLIQKKIPNRGKGGHKVISLPKELLAVDKFWESYNQFSLLMVQPYWVNHPSMKTTHPVYGMYKGNTTRLGGLKGKKKIRNTGRLGRKNRSGRILPFWNWQMTKWETNTLKCLQKKNLSNLKIYIYLFNAYIHTQNTHTHEMLVLLNFLLLLNVFN